MSRTGYRYCIILLLLTLVFVSVLIIWQMTNRPGGPLWMETAHWMDDDADSSADTEAMTDTEPPLPVQAGEAPLMPLCWETALYYDTERGRLMMDTWNAGVTADTITWEANYFFDEYMFALGHDTGRRKSISVGDTYIEKIIVSGSSLTLYCRQGYYIASSGDDRYVYWQLVDPKERHSTIVVIDPGHGDEDSGALIDRIQEKNVNLDIALRLADALAGDENIHILLTRTEDTRPSLEDRYKLANDMGDYFISIHNNMDEHSRRSHGTVTYYHNHRSDRPITSEALAQAVQDALVAKLGSRDRGIEDSNEYRLLINTRIPTVIAEVLFMSNPEELERLADPVCRQDIASALAEVIRQLPPARMD